MADRYQSRDAAGRLQSREFATTGGNPADSGRGLALDSNGMVDDSAVAHRVYFYTGDTIPPPAPAGAPAQYRLVQFTTSGDILRWVEDGT